jgi:hypothetical protein
MRIAIVSLTALLSAGLGFVACSDEPARSVDLPDSGNTSTDATTNSDSPNANKPVVEFKGDTDVPGGSKVSKDTTLGADKVHLMKGIVYVASGVTLKIEAGTEIRGEQGTQATLVIQPGGKIDAQGTKDSPIVFTSQGKEGAKAPGDWGGVIILGKAPINGGRATDAGISQEAYIEGLNVSPENRYGGSDPGDNSGVLTYVRIEYGGVRLGTDNEINGLTLGGVGSGTKIEHIQVRYTLDDCFEWFGGTVNAKWLICDANQDDGLDYDNGWTGKLQFAIIRPDPAFDDEMNGIEADNDALGTAGTPITSPTISNVTLCGQNTLGTKRKFGMLLRRNTGGIIRNALVWGYDAALDIRNSGTHARAKGSSQPVLQVQGSWFHSFKAANLIEGLVLPETSTGEQAFAEIDFLKDAANSNVLNVDPEFDCRNVEAPVFAPKTPNTEKAIAPTDPYFDTTAKYIGAVKDSSDKWYAEGWVKWTKPGF